MSSLAPECWFDVFKFCPYLRLWQRIAFVCARFAVLANAVLEKAHPRRVELVTLKWDKMSNSLHAVVEKSGWWNTHCLWAEFPLPNVPPPKCILGFDAIRIERGVPPNHDLIDFLALCKTKIERCTISIGNPTELLQSLDTEGILLDQFFCAFSRCEFMGLKFEFADLSSYGQIVPRFLTTEFVQDCPSLYIEHPNFDFDLRPLHNWLMNRGPSSNGAPRTLGLDRCPREENEKVILGRICKFVKELLGEREKVDERSTDFVMELHGMELDKELEQFNSGNGTMELAKIRVAGRGAEWCWQMRRRGNSAGGDGEPIFARYRGATYIEIGYEYGQ